MADAAAVPDAAPRGPAAEPRASAADWIAVAAGALGALMATLDISITNSALPQIQGSIGATGTEGTWISTGYLMSEIVMIPLAAWLTRVFGLRNFLLGNALLFAMFSVMCGLSHSLAQMIVGRIGQGFMGGAMIPTAQTIIRTRLPRSQMPLGMTMFGLIVLLGPLLGPVVGGWLAENISWTWCFLVNLPVCAALVLLLLGGLPSDKPRWQDFHQGRLAGHRGPGHRPEQPDRGPGGRPARALVRFADDHHADRGDNHRVHPDRPVPALRGQAHPAPEPVAQSTLCQRDHHRGRRGCRTIWRVLPGAAVS
jgi:DHA2 family multidrug resistance protein